MFRAVILSAIAILLTLCLFGNGARADESNADDSSAAESGLQLSAGGKSSFVIVTSPTPSAEESGAAELLAAMLLKVTGAEYPIRSRDAPDLPKTQIVLEQSSALPSEAWSIRTSADSLFITGGFPRGLYYGVCEFLESHVGVYRFDPLTTILPTKPDLELSAIDRAGKPAFDVRVMYTGFPRMHANTDWENVARFHVCNKNNNYGGLSEGDFVRHLPDGVHTFGKFVSVKEFAHDHPEYFSMDAEGKRTLDDRGTVITLVQLCMTNEDVRRITLERARKALRADAAEADLQDRPPAPYLVISQNDSTTDLCLCPKCKAISDREGSQSGALLDFVNFIASGVNEEFPKILVMTDAYNFTLPVPKKIRPEANVIVRYYDNYGFSDLTRPLADPRNARPMGLLAAWTKAAKQVAVGDYWRVNKSAPNGFFAPAVSTRANHKDLKMFHKLGVRYVSVEAEDFLSYGFDAHCMSSDLQSFMTLKTWIGMKLLDNPHRELDSLLDTFFTGYFGPAARPMRELHDWIEVRQAQVPVRIVDVQRHVWARLLCDAEFFVGAYRHLDEAVALAKDDSAVLARIARERLVVDSAYLWTEQSVKRADPKAGDKLPARSEVLSRFRQDWQRFLSATFTAQGVSEATPLAEPCWRLVESLKPEDTNCIAEAIAAREAEITLDGKLNEPVWKSARPMRLLPRDVKAANDDPSVLRYAWTPKALIVSIEQPIGSASGAFEVSLIEPDLKGVMLTMYCYRDRPVEPYFYKYKLATGSLERHPRRKSGAKAISTSEGQQSIIEIRIPWSDLGLRPRPGSELQLNISSFPLAAAQVRSHVSSACLVGDGSLWNPTYFSFLRLVKDK